MTFLVDENLENFQEIHGWMRGLGFPESYTEYADGLALTAQIEVQQVVVQFQQNQVK